jgi:hypothetical protein
MTSPSSVLESLVDQVADEILFGGPPQPDTVRLPAALRSLALDVMAMTTVRDPQRVEQRVVNEFCSRLDLRLRTACDDVTGARWRLLLRGLQARFPTCH